MSWITPVTDHKDGEAYSHVDMNRVGNNIQYLADQLNSYGYSVTVKPKTNWVSGEIPTFAQITQYLTDLQFLKNKFYGTTILPVTMDDLAEDSANNIEKLLIEIEINIRHLLLSFKYSAEALCGEV